MYNIKCIHFTKCTKCNIAFVVLCIEPLHRTIKPKRNLCMIILEIYRVCFILINALEFLRYYIDKIEILFLRYEYFIEGTYFGEQITIL